MEEGIKISPDDNLSQSCQRFIKWKSEEEEEEQGTTFWMIIYNHVLSVEIFLTLRKRRNVRLIGLEQNNPRAISDERNRSKMAEFDSCN